MPGCRPRPGHATGLASQFCCCWHCGAVGRYTELLDAVVTKGVTGGMKAFFNVFVEQAPSGETMALLDQHTLVAPKPW